MLNIPTPNRRIWTPCSLKQKNDAREVGSALSDSDSSRADMKVRSLYRLASSANWEIGPTQLHALSEDTTHPTPSRPIRPAVQDGRAADPTCPVLHAAACRKLLDTTLVPADRCAHRAARVAPDVIGWTAQAGSRVGSGGGVATEGGQLAEEARSGCWRRENEPFTCLRAGSMAVGVSRRRPARVKRGRRWVQIANPGSSV